MIADCPPKQTECILVEQEKPTMNFFAGIPNNFSFLNLVGYSSSYTSERFNIIEQLEENWDSYGARPFKKDFLKSVKELAENLECVDAEITRISPAGDGAIVIDATIRDELTRWEIDSDSDVGLTQYSPDGPVYKDTVLDEIQKASSIEALLID